MHSSNTTLSSVPYIQYFQIPGVCVAIRGIPIALGIRFYSQRLFILNSVPSLAIHVSGIGCVANDMTSARWLARECAVESERMISSVLLFPYQSVLCFQFPNTLPMLISFNFSWLPLLDAATMPNNFSFHCCIGSSESDNNVVTSVADTWFYLLLMST